MATRCTDISENRKLTSVSPISLGAFLASFVILSALMRPSILYLICVLISYALCQLLFYYKPRLVILSIKFLTQNSYLTPTFVDTDYLFDENEIDNLTAVLKGSENAPGKTKSSS